MKKFIPFFLIVILILCFTGCENQEAGSNAAQTSIVKSESEIKEIAYDYLSDAEKDTVLNYESAEVKGYKCSEDHVIGGLNGQVNINDKDTYMVTFNTTDDALLGPITVYIDKNSYGVLGIDYRD
ncbi:MAG: hypothetical protein R2876_04370 [Eubacteriales bacterium]